MLGRWSTAVALAVCVACNRGEEAVPKDSVVDVFKGSAPEPQAQAVAPSKIGTVPVFKGLEQDGRCSVQRFSGITAAMQAELSFHEDSPTRDILVGIGDAARNFRPMNIDARMQYTGNGLLEVEQVVASFDADGGVKGGQRQYYTGNNDVRERRDVIPEDFSSIRDLASAVYQRCMPAQ